MFDRDAEGEADEDERPGRDGPPDRPNGLGRMREVARSVARSAGSVARTVVAPAGLRALAVEGAWCAAHALIYPFPLHRGRPSCPCRQHRTEAMPLEQRSRMICDLIAQGVPVLVLHGSLDHRSTVDVLERELRRHGSGVLHAVDYGELTATGDVRMAAHELRGHVDRVRELTGADRVRLVAYSLGGVIARYLVQRLGGDAVVDTLVTVGSPHGGTRAAHLWPTALARQLIPGSELLTELTEPAPGCRTRFLVVASRMDQFVVPAGNALVEHPDLRVDTLELPDAGHLSLTVHPEAVRWVTSRIARSSGRGHPMSGTIRRGRRPLNAVPNDAGRTPLTVR
jgi:pimeloyl-ACP methyl ester carboxylesterase